MPMDQLWIIESRDAEGQLDFKAPQPESLFGMSAITGITEDRMAKVIYGRNAEVTLDGRCIATWPRVLDSRFTARRKTW